MILAALALCAPLAFEPAADYGRILFTGNSIMEGHQSDTLGWQGGYRRIIEDDLVRRRIGHTFVGVSEATSEGMRQKRHCAFGGKTIVDLLNGITIGERSYGRLEAWVRDLKPDIVMVDAGRGDWTKDGAEAEGPVRKFLDVVFQAAPRAAVIWCGQTPPDPAKYPNALRDIAAVNGAIQRAVNQARSRGQRAAFSPAPSPWSAAIDLDRDGVHPSDAGFRRLAASHLKTLDGVAGAAGRTTVAFRRGL